MGRTGGQRHHAWPPRSPPAPACRSRARPRAAKAVSNPDPAPLPNRNTVTDGAEQALPSASQRNGPVRRDESQVAKTVGFPALLRPLRISDVSGEGIGEIVQQVTPVGLVPE